MARRRGIAEAAAAAAWLVLLVASGVSADVSPGDVIAQGNWQKAEGLLPEPVLAWVKKGDFILNVGEIDFDPTTIHPEFVLEGFENNRGRYAIGPEGGIVEKEGGKLAKLIVGLPFPELDP